MAYAPFFNCPTFGFLYFTCLRSCCALTRLKSGFLLYRYNFSIKVVANKLEMYERSPTLSMVYAQLSCIRDQRGYRGRLCRILCERHRLFSASRHDRQLKICRVGCLEHSSARQSADLFRQICLHFNPWDSMSDQHTHLSSYKSRSSGIIESQPEDKTVLGGGDSESKSRSVLSRSDDNECCLLLWGAIFC